MDMPDDAQEMGKRDTGGMLSILGSFDRQIEDSLEIAEKISLPPDGAALRNVVITGLGGSAIGGDFVKVYLGEELRLPVQVNRNYGLPPFVDHHTLVLVCSYSGNTEETISAFHQARRAGARVVCITSNGEIQQLAETFGYPLLKIPSGYPPRTALAYSAIPILGVLSRLAVAPDRSDQIRDSVPFVRKMIANYGPGTPRRENAARELAAQVQGRLAVVYGSQDRLEMVAVRWRGQFSENGKALAYSGALPEMNHNEIVGWKHPQSLLQQMVPIFLRDRDDHPRVQIRADLTRELLRQKAGGVLEYWTQGDGWLERLWSLILLGDYASVYLAFLNQEDPTPVEVIDDLKVRLKGL